MEMEMEVEMENEKKTNRSPFFLALLQSDSDIAISPSVVSPDLIRCSWPRKISNASSLERVISDSRQLLGRRLPRCLMRRWLARILPSTPPAP